MAFVLDSNRIPLAPASASPVEGASSPLGATIRPGGVNFSIFSRDASEVELLLFDRKDDARPAGCGLTHRKFSLTHMGAVWPFPGTTAARPQAGKVTTLLRQ